MKRLPYIHKLYKQSSRSQSSTVKRQPQTFVKKMSTQPRPVVKSSTMTPNLQDCCINVAQKAIESEGSSSDIAASIRNEMQVKHGSNTWHCLVGRDFGCYVNHVEGNYVYFYVGQIGVCLFATE